MNKEELKQEAEEWLCSNLHSASEEDFIKAMVDIAEPREKRIAELEAQIEKMKCCANCKYYQFQNDAEYHTCTKDGKRNGKYYRSCEFNLEKWEGR